MPSAMVKIAQLFHDHWQLPHCIGAADGKHVRILHPHDSIAGMLENYCQINVTTENVPQYICDFRKKNLHCGRLCQRQTTFGKSGWGRIT